MEKMNIFAIPYAVGSANIYNDLKYLLSDAVSIVPVELSGHGSRTREPLCETIQQMAEDIYKRIENKLNEPYCLFGYSMGSLVSYELYILIEKYKKRLPEHIFLLASDSPHARREVKNYQQMGLKEIVEELKCLHATEEALENEELMEMIYPVAKNDFIAVESYQATELKNKIQCTASVFRGDKEKILDNNIRDWMQYFETEIKCEFVEGGHFFLFDNMEKGIQKIQQELDYLKVSGA